MIPLSQVRPPSELQLPLTLKWRWCRNMPCVMVSPQSVTLGEDMFVGRGLTDSLYDDDDHTVYQYHPPTDQWVPLPQYECVSFAMAILTNKLVLVGGYNTSTYQVTNQIAVWDTEGISRGWKHSYPPMTTPHHSPAVATYERQLVVAGGRGDADRLATVEVLDTTSCQWMGTSPLPVNCADMTSAIVDQELYLMGGTLTTETLVVSPPPPTYWVAVYTNNVSVCKISLQFSSNCSWQAGRHGRLVDMDGCAAVIAMETPMAIYY